MISSCVVYAISVIVPVAFGVRVELLADSDELVRALDLFLDQFADVSLRKVLVAAGVVGACVAGVGFGAVRY